MAHNSRCQNATTPPEKCTCSGCGGWRHGDGSPYAAIAKSVGTSAMVAGASVVVPGFREVYATYKVLKFGELVYNRVKDGGFENTYSTLRNLLVSDTASKISERKAAGFANDITSIAEGLGLVKDLASRVGIDRDTIASMFNRTVRGAATGGASKLALYVVT